MFSYFYKKFKEQKNVFDIIIKHTLYLRRSSPNESEHVILIILFLRQYNEIKSIILTLKKVNNTNKTKFFLKKINLLI